MMPFVSSLLFSFPKSYDIKPFIPEVVRFTLMSIGRNGIFYFREVEMGSVLLILIFYKVLRFIGYRQQCAGLVATRYISP